MRELKFRAYDLKKREWICVGFHLIGEVTVFEMLRGYSMPEWNDIEVTQYSGINDKRGIEIYAGDIAEIQHPYKNRSWRGEIKIDDYRFYGEGFFFPHYDCSDDMFSSGREYIEIVDNKYGTPIPEEMQWAIK